MNLKPEMTKVEQGGTLNSNTIHDRAGLFFGAFGMAVAFLAIGLCLSMWLYVRDLTTEVKLLREDVRELTIEVQKGK